MPIRPTGPKHAPSPRDQRIRDRHLEWAAAVRATDLAVRENALADRTPRADTLEPDAHLRARLSELLELGKEKKGETMVTMKMKATKESTEVARIYRGTLLLEFRVGELPPHLDEPDAERRYPTKWPTLTVSGKTRAKSSPRTVESLFGAGDAVGGFAGVRLVALGPEAPKAPWQHISIGSVDQVRITMPPVLLDKHAPPEGKTASDLYKHGVVEAVCSVEFLSRPSPSEDGSYPEPSGVAGAVSDSWVSLLATSYAVRGVAPFRVGGGPAHPRDLPTPGDTAEWGHPNMLWRPLTGWFSGYEDVASAASSAGSFIDSLLSGIRVEPADRVVLAEFTVPGDGSSAVAEVDEEEE